MNSSLLSIGAKRLGAGMIRNAGSIYTAIAVSGVFTTAIAAADGHVKALDILWEHTSYKDMDHLVNENDQIFLNFSIKERMNLTWKCYIPAVASGIITIGFIIAANRWHLRKEAALVGLYTLTERAYQEYKKKVVDTIGKAKEEDIRGAIAQDALDKHPLKNSQVIITGDGDHLVFDRLSGRYFKSNIEKIREIQNRLNFQAINDSYILLNDLYYELGLENIQLGERNGWAVEYALIDIQFSSKIADNGEPCLVMDFQIAPGKVG